MPHLRAHDLGGSAGRLEGVVLTERQMSELTTDKSIYMIFRVFNMGSSSISARIYLDPDRMRQEGRLRFSADRWTVTPGLGLLA